MLGAKHRVGPTHMPCQSSLMSLLPQASKISFWFNAKLMQGVFNTLREERKERSKRQGSFGLVKKLKQNSEPFSHFGVSSRESKTQRKREIHLERCSLCEEIERNTVRV